MRNPCENVLDTTQERETLLKPVSSGEEICSADHFWGPGVRNTYVIHYVISGKGVLYCGTNKFHLHRGQIFIIFPDTVVKYQSDPSDPWHYAWVVFKGGEAKGIFENMGISYKNPVYTPNDGERLLKLLRAMPEERNIDMYDNLRFSSVLYDFMAQLVDCRSVETKNENIYLSSALGYIRAHYSEELSVDLVASYVGISRKYLFAIFKNSLGVSPKDYILDYRMNKACDLLGNKTLSVGNVAYSVGYKDPLTFSRMFKVKKGV